jgi:hypothetical protein
MGEEARHFVAEGCPWLTAPSAATAGGQSRAEHKDKTDQVTLCVIAVQPTSAVSVSRQEVERHVHLHGTQVANVTYRMRLPIQQASQCPASLLPMHVRQASVHALTLPYVNLSQAQPATKPLP